VQEPLTNFLIGIIALEIGLLLFFLRRKFPQFNHFFDSMIILILFMASISPTIGLLSEHKGGMYWFILIFLIGTHVWLVFTRYVIFDKNKWHDDISFKPVQRAYFVLMGLFFVGSILLVIFIPLIPKWTLP